MLTSLKAAAARADPAFIALALAAYAISVLIVALRWRVVLSGVTRDRAPLGPLVLATLASSFVNNVTPGGRLGGEACRVVALVRLRLATMSRAAAVIAYERFSEAPAVLGIALAALLVVGRVPRARALLAPWRLLSILALVAAVLCLIALLMMVPRLARPLRRVRDRWRTVASIAIAPSALAISALLSAVVWTLDVFRVRLVAAAFHAPIGLTETAMLTAITIVAGLVPTIGGLGAIEGGLIAGMIGLGVAPLDAVAITAVERGISWGLASILGAGSLSLLGGRSLWNAVRPSTPEAEGAST